MKNESTMSFIKAFSELYSKNPKDAIKVLELQSILSEIQTVYSPTTSVAGNNLNIGIPGVQPPDRRLISCEEVFKDAYNKCQASSLNRKNCFSIAYQKYKICETISSPKNKSNFWNTLSENNSENYPMISEAYDEAITVFKKCIETIQDSNTEEKIKNLKIQELLNKLKVENPIMNL